MKKLLKRSSNNHSKEIRIDPVIKFLYLIYLKHDISIDQIRIVPNIRDTILQQMKIMHNERREFINNVYDFIKNNKSKGV